MKRLTYVFLDEFVEDVINSVENAHRFNEFASVAVYGHFDLIKEVLEELIRCGASISTEIELEDCEVSAYDKEFVLHLNKYDDDGDELSVNVEKIWDDESKLYLYDEADVAYVHEDCSSKLLRHIETDVKCEFGFEDECDDEDMDECNCCAECCNDKPEKYVEFCKDDDGNLHGFTASKSDGGSYVSYSYYGSRNLSKAEIQSLMQEAGF